MKLQTPKRYHCQTGQARLKHMEKIPPLTAVLPSNSSRSVWPISITAAAWIVIGALTIDTTIDALLVIRTLRQPIGERQPTPGLIHHTDHGGQYAASEYRAILARLAIKQSMSRAGDCYDNAFMESCFGTVKTELEMTT